jgi:hypothetical protein
VPHFPVLIANQLNETYWDPSLPLNPIAHSIDWYYSEIKKVNDDIISGIKLAKQLDDQITRLIGKGEAYLHSLKIYEQMMNRDLGYTKNKCEFDIFCSTKDQNHTINQAYTYSHNTDNNVEILYLKHLIDERAATLRDHLVALHGFHAKLLPVLTLLKANHDNCELVFNEWNKPGNKIQTYSTNNSMPTSPGSHSIFAQPVAPLEANSVTMATTLTFKQ